MAGKIEDKLAELKGKTEAELEEINKWLANYDKTRASREARKAELEAMLGEFTSDFPAVVAKPVNVKPGKPGKIGG